MKPVKKQVDTLLKSIPHDELHSFIYENTQNDKKFRNYFLAYFAEYNQESSKKFYQKQIRSILNTAAGRHGFIDWSGMKYVGKSLQPFLDNAYKYFERNDFKRVYYIAASILEEMTKALQFADDSNGEIGFFIDQSLQLLINVAEKDVSPTFRKEVFDYCISSFKKEKFEGWDWHLGILRIAGKLAQDEKETDIIIKELRKLKDWFYQEEAQNYELELLKKFKDEREVDQFIKRHISNPKIRNQEIEHAFETAEFDRAISLSKDGIAFDKEDKPGLVKDWYDWLLRIALQQDDKPKIVKYARYRLMNDFGASMDYYQILKDTVDPENWYSFLEEIIEEIKASRYGKNKPLLRKIYINEKWWERLLAMTQKDPSLYTTEDNEQYLKKDYASELIELYENSLKEYLERNVGRNHYKTACRYLRRIKKLGGNDEMEKLIGYFKDKYARRPALLDELSRV